MSEKLHQPREPERREPAPKEENWYPTEQELREFEELHWWEELTNDRESFLATTIEEFARDPENPTPDEIKAVEILNSDRPRLTTFEEYFGRPDSRKRQGEQESQAEVTPQQDDWYPTKEQIQSFDETISPLGISFELNFGRPRRAHDETGDHVPAADDHGNDPHQP